MPKKEKELRELESKIQDLSHQLRATEELVLFALGLLQDTTDNFAVWNEKRRIEAEKTEKKFEMRIFYQSLILGLLLGIVGNLFVSYFMKALEIFKIPSEVWILISFGALAITFTLIGIFYREIKKVSP